MSSTYSSNLRVELIGSGDQAGTWGTTTDNNFAYIFDTAIAGINTVTVTSINQALTYINGPTSTAALNQSIYAILKFDSAAAASAIYAPPVSKQYIIWNNSSFTITIYNSTVIGNTTAAGTGVAIAAGGKVMVWSDGTNFYDVQTQSLAGILLGANGGTGVANTSKTITLGGNLVTSGAFATTLTSTGTTAVTLPTTGTLATLAGTETLTNKTINGSNNTITNVSLASGVTGTLPVVNGGTGTTSPSIVAGTNITVSGTWPNQTINASSGGGGTVTSVNGSGGSTGLTLTGGPITSTGTLTLGGTLAVANGGTNASTAANALTNLGALPALNPSYTGTLTGGTGVISIGSGQLGKDAAGNLLVGTTAATNNSNTFTVASAKSALILGSSVSADANALLDLLKFGATASTSQVYVSFAYNSGANGNGLITGAGAGQAQFTANSDIRLKENIVDLPSQLANIMALRPVEFDYKAEKAHQIGFIAQEVKEIYPDLIGETKDGYLTLSGLDKNASRLIKAIQELKAIVDAQAARIAVLESR